MTPGYQQWCQDQAERFGDYAADHSELGLEYPSRDDACVAAHFGRLALGQSKHESDELLRRVVGEMCHAVNVPDGSSLLTEVRKLSGLRADLTSIRDEMKRESDDPPVNAKIEGFHAACRLWADRLSRLLAEQE